MLTHDREASFPFGVKRITSSRFQAPDEPNDASHNVTTSPPATPIFFSLFCARKAMKRESADQNG